MIKRGEIYFVKRRADLSFGSETAKSRPGIIVSNNALNATSDVVEVVYLTTQPKKDLPTHVNIDATGTSSVALCEHIDHVSVNLLGSWCGVCSDAEMVAIDCALMRSLGLGIEENDESNDETATDDDVGMVELYEAYVRATAERDAYKAMFDKTMAIVGLNLNKK
jgi:mRNA interferase MazF